MLPRRSLPVQQAQAWWWRLSPQLQDSWAMLAPLAAVLLFLAAIVSALGYLLLEEIDREHEALKRDVQYTQQKLRLRLLEQREQLLRVGSQIPNQKWDAAMFQARTEALMAQYPALQGVSWLDEKNQVRASAGMAHRSPEGFQDLAVQLQAGHSVFEVVQRQLDAADRPEAARLNEPAVLRLFVPLNNGARFSGVLLAQYAIDSLFRYDVPAEVSARYAISFRDAEGRLLAGIAPPAHPTPASRLLPWAGPINAYQIPVSLVGNRLFIYAQAYKTSLDVVGNGLFWLATTLSVMTAWMLLANWRHVRKRLQAQQALVSETAFRRAMENSMLTGMRALDLQGRITYVNAAFCRMTGWSEHELVGQRPPFPYWPEADYDMLMAQLAQALAGDNPPGGIQMRVQRRDGSLFDARLYVSPLIDSHNVQTGWMTSITDITEPHRAREQLAAAHNRFTTVLEALDASVSVVPLGGEELLFANKRYRLWFGPQSNGHRQLATQAGAPTAPTSQDLQDSVDAFVGLPTDGLAETDTESTEVYLESLSLWLEVRSRYLSWVDGRLAQMVIATDITARRFAEDQAAAQVERAHTANRLITMGEMASSVAHELNQPLTAINNYCTGMVLRIQAEQISNADLLETLEKTARQAQRAGQIIQRIHSFVKRSKPNRTPTQVGDIVEEAVELANIELRRRNVRLTHAVQPKLPLLRVDPILIEQVLVNLLKNAAESIDAAQRPTAQRSVNLQVTRQKINGKDAVEFCISDTGHGLLPETAERLYEAFYSTKADGMGIGLNLCRSIVESHQGRIQAQNIYNAGQIAGCCFTFWIPWLPEPDAEPATAPAGVGLSEQPDQHKAPV